jgi:hypothetical protein
MKPERLMELARQGSLSKRELAALLAPEKRQAFLDACAALERRYTQDCTATGDPCLEGGCAVEGEICLEPILRAGADYARACGAEWVKLFGDPDNSADKPAA